MENKLITIAKYSFSKSEMVKSILEAENIECYLNNANVIQPHLGSAVKVQIKSSDVEKALKIIVELEKSYVVQEEAKEKDNLVTVGAYNYTRAQILKNRLEVEGIECFLKNLNLVQPHVGSGVKVRIHERDIEKALPTIIQLSKEYGEDSGLGEEYKSLKKIDRILLPIDFSNFSSRAVRYALKIAEAYQAEIHLFHAFYNPAVYAEPFTEGYAYHLNVYSYIRDLEKESAEYLEKFKRELLDLIAERKIEGVNVDATLVSGLVDSEITNMAKIYKPDLIIIGMKGENDQRDEAIGVNTSKIIQNVEMPVLAIPEKDSLKEMEEIKNVMYATDLDRTDFVSLRKLVGIMGKMKPKIHCVHISTQKDDGWSKAKFIRLNQYIKKRYSQYDIECHHIQHENKIMGVEEYINQNKINLIAINTRKKNILEKLFGSNITEQMIYQTEIPLLVFHA